MKVTTSNSSATLAVLSETIRVAHQHAELAQRDALRFAVDAGNALAEAKKVCGHGSWLPWLASHCELSERTAQAYMRLAKKMAAMPAEEAQRVADLSLREAIRVVAEPKASTTQEAAAGYLAKFLIKHARDDDELRRVVAALLVLLDDPKLKRVVIQHLEADDRGRRLVNLPEVETSLTFMQDQTRADFFGLVSAWQ